MRVQKYNTELAQKGAKFSHLLRLPQLRAFTGSDFQLLEQQDDFDLRAGLGVTYPLYDAGNIRRQIAAAESLYRQAQIQLDIVRAETELKAKESFWSYKNQLSLYEIIRERKELAEKDYKRSKQELERGNLSEVSFQEMEIAYRRALRQFEDIQLDVILAREHLLQVTALSSFEEIEEIAAEYEKTALLQ